MTMMPPRDVLAAYPVEFRLASWHPIRDAGGFSGARIWRGDTPLGSWRLKAWPDISESHLAFVHELMRLAPLAMTPRVLNTTAGGTLVSFGCRLWDIVTWRPGSPDLLADPTPARLHAAGRALAELHAAWRRDHEGPCPGVLRRLHSLSTYQETPSTLLLLARLADQVTRHRERAIEELLPWRTIPVPLQPCLCDIWAEHVLFDGDKVTGLIDFGSCKIDHPATDLARLLGSCLGGNRARWTPLFEGYETVRQLKPLDYRLIETLERTGAVVAAIHWLCEGPAHSTEHGISPRIEQRVKAILQRLLDS